jgi:pyridoxamine 5'-phosphate oxidase
MNLWAQLCGLPGILRGLDEKDAPANPIVLFRKWFSFARKSCLYWPNSVSLATATKDARPSVRLVLLKGFDDRGFVFYTNYDSRKGHELTENPQAALAFYWNELLRQVRAEGLVERVSDAEADAYFASRGRGKQIGAWASHQSSVLHSREELLARYQELEQQHAGKPIPRPPNWGGYRLLPERIEFWQGRSHRLHDRILYVREGQAWRIERLAP